LTVETVVITACFLVEGVRRHLSLVAMSQWPILPCLGITGGWCRVTVSLLQACRVQCTSRDNNLL